MTPANIAEYEVLVYSLPDTYPSLLSSTMRVVRTGPAAGRVVGTLTFARPNLPFLIGEIEQPLSS